MNTDNVTLIPSALERHARSIKRALARRDGARHEWIEGTIEVAVELAAARDTFSSDKAFGQWCDENGFGKGVLNAHDRAALIAMGEQQQPLRLCLEASSRTSIRLIHDEEWSRFASTAKPKRNRGGSSKAKGEPNGDKPKSDKPKLAKADQEARAREIVRPMVAAGLSIDYRVIGEQHGIAHVTVEKAARIERVLLHEPQITVDIDTLAPTAKEKLEAAKRQETRRLQAEHAARMRTIDEEVRQRVVSQGKDYLDTLKEQEQQVWSDRQLYTNLINNNKPVFTIDQFNLLRKCLHQSGIAAKPADFDEAFRLIQSRKLQLTGEQ